MACCVHHYIDNDVQSLRGIRLGRDGIVWGREGEIVVVALAVVSVRPWLSGGLRSGVGTTVVDLG